MKILVIFTGGTIGSTIDNKYISPDGNTSLLLQMYREKYDASDIRIETAAPFFVLSENLTLGHVKKLAGIIKKAEKKDYEAVILTHGTDTIQYTASMLEWMCGDMNTPVFIVSSNRVLSEKDANGLDNFHGAVVAARKGIKGGVYVSYRNPGEPVHIHRGILLLPHEIFSEKLYSVQNKIYAAVERDKLILHDADYTDQECRGIGPLAVRNREPRILMLHIYPDMSGVFEGSRFFENIDAVILISYHSGTLPTDDKDFIRFCENARQKNIPVYVCGTYMEYGYISTKKYEELSIISVPWVSPTALYTRLISLSTSGC